MTDRDLYPDKAAWARRVKTSPVRVQWDPERTLRLGPLPYRSLQVGLSGEAVDHYIDDWIVGIRDVTARAHAIRDLLAAGEEAAARDRLPIEQPYPLPTAVGTRIGIAAETGTGGVAHTGF